MIWWLYRNSTCNTTCNSTCYSTCNSTCNAVLLLIRMVITIKISITDPFSGNAISAPIHSRTYKCVGTTGTFFGGKIVGGSRVCVKTGLWTMPKLDAINHSINQCCQSQWEWGIANYKPVRIISNAVTRSLDKQMFKTTIDSEGKWNFQVRFS